MIDYVIRGVEHRRVRPSRFTLAAAIVTLWALLANLGRIGFPVQGFDEPYYATAAWRYIHGDGNPPPAAFSNYDNFEHPPFAKYLFGLAQLVAGHPSVVADRVVAALCTLGSAAVTGVWAGRVAGRWVGLGAAGLIAVLPMSVPGFAFRFGRYGYLDPVAELFAVGSVALAWEWFRREGRAGWWYAAATGVCVGLASSSKENGFLGVVGPVVVGLVAVVRDGRVVLTRLLQTVVAVTVSCATFAVTYLGLGHPVSAFRFMLHYQLLHARLGHRVEFDGRVAVHPPGWAFLWFAEHGLGTAVTIVCLVCACAAILLRRDKLVLWCCAALAAPLLFHIFIARIVLGFYWVMWMPAFLALVALGVNELARLPLERASRGFDLRSAVGAVAALGSLLVLLWASAQDTNRMITRTVPAGQVVTYSAKVLAHHPLVYLPLDDRPGSTTARDASPLRHSGRYENRPTLGSPGLVGATLDRAVTLDGSTQYVSIAGAAWMNRPDYTIAVWFRTDAAGGYLAARDDYLRGKVWDVLIDPAGRVEFLTFRPGHGAGQPVTSRRAYNDGRPHFAVCTLAGTTMRLYLDGALVASAQYPAVLANGAPIDIDLGRRGNGAGYLAATLDDFAFYGKALSAREVNALYRAGNR